MKYLNEKNDQRNDNLFSIKCQNNEKSLEENICKMNEIEISHQAIEILQAKNQLWSIEFENHLTNFGAVSFEIKYPSSTFDNIYAQTLNLKNKINERTRIII